MVPAKPPSPLFWQVSGPPVLRVWQPAPAAAQRPAPSKSEPVGISFEQVPVHVGTMHLLVANGAVLEARASQIMQCRRHGTQCAIDGRAGSRKIGVAFHADEPNLRPGEHARIGGTVRLMARRTALQSHGSMFENEGASLIAMTL